MNSQPAKNGSFPRAEPTPLAALLGATAAAPELVAHRGALTPSRLGRLERETAALVAGAAVHDLGWLRRVAVGGEDRFRWLNGMVTNTVKDLNANSGAWNLVLNAQGRIQGDLCVWREADALELEIAADQYGRLLAHLERFIIMDDVELMPRSLDAQGALTGETALGLTGPEAAMVLGRLGWRAPAERMTSVGVVWNGVRVRIDRAYGVLTPHYDLWVMAEWVPALWRALVEAGATPAGAEALEALRIAEGIPVYGIDMAERDLPQETGQTNALSFDKGCYLGQEIVERIRSRGGVHRSLRQLELFGAVPEAGAELSFGQDVAVGQITSAAELVLPEGRRCFALGMLRSEAGLAAWEESATGGPGQGLLSLTYQVAGGAATARVLKAAPALNVDAAQETGPESGGSERMLR
ncbi:MAG: YgfZ/GcvT domain-containing protein [Terracidiphilus sp.]